MKHLLELAKGVELPVDALMQPFGLFGNRGGGKTYGGTKLFELAHAAGVQCVAIDPIAKWWAVRLGADGRSPGLAEVYIFGGKRADFPLLADKGAFTAKLVVEKRIHAVLDVSLMRKAERKRFVADFAEEFYLLKKQEDAPTPAILFLEEAHAFAPQKPQKGEERMLGAIEDIVSEGRNAGLGCVLIDQRTARVNKNCVTLTEVMIALKTIHQLDRAAIADWVVQKGLGVDLLKQLPFLEQGEGFMYAPGYGVNVAKMKILQKRTFDASATAKVGGKLAQIGKLTPVDREAVGAAMAEVVAEAEKSDPKALRRRVLELESQLARRPAQPEEKRIEVPVFREGEVEALEAAALKVSELGGKLQHLLAKVNEVRGEQPDFNTSSGRALIRAHLDIAETDAGRATKKPYRPPQVQSEKWQRENQPEKRPEGLAKGEHVVLTACAQQQGATREELTLLTGYRRSTRDKLIQHLKAKGLVEEQDDCILPSEAGYRLLGPSLVPLPTGDALREHWMQRLPEGERRVLQCAIHAYPRPVAKEQIDKETGYKTSTRNKLIQHLTRRRLVTSPTTGELRASDLLFSTGRAA